MKAVVIGAGLQGICTAYFLSLRGVEVTVLEREAGPALGASYANGGYLQNQCPEVWNAPGIWRALPSWWLASLKADSDHNAMLVRTRALPGAIGWGLRFLRASSQGAYFANTLRNFELAAYTRDVMAEIRDRERFDYHASDSGAVFVCRSKRELDNLRSLLAYLAAHGAQYRELTAGELVDVEPALGSIAAELHGGLMFPGDESGDAHVFCRQLAAVAAVNGAKFEYDVDVSGLKQRPDGIEVRSSQGVVTGDAAVLAAGCWTPRIAPTIGLRVPIAPAKGYSLTIDIGDWPRPPRHVVVDMSVHAAISVLGNRLRVAGTAEFAGYDDQLTKAREAYLVSLVDAIFPEFASTMDLANVNAWAGLRPLSADGIPLIGETAVPGLFLNTGHGGLGWTQAAGSAKALADAMTGAEGAYDLAPFAPGRFKGIL